MITGASTFSNRFLRNRYFDEDDFVDVDFFDDALLLAFLMCEGKWQSTQVVGKPAVW